MNHFRKNVSIQLGILILSGVIIAGCSTAPSLKESSPSELYELAQKHYQAKRYEKASEYFHQYIANYSESHLYKVALYYLGVCYQQMHDDKQAAAIFHKIITQYPDDDFWVMMARKRTEETEGLTKK